MVIMVLDHVRDFFHADAQRVNPEDLANTTGAIFFTRWITHFCAPVFVFLAGPGIHFMAQRRASIGAASRVLVGRGLWLILLGVTVASFRLVFDFYLGLILP